MTKLETVADAVDALIDPVQVRERIEWWDANRNKKVRYHEHALPCLLQQLHMARVPGLMFSDEANGGRRRPVSAPPARLEALSAAAQIDTDCAVWVRRADVADRYDTEANLRALVGARLEPDVSVELLRDLNRWYGWAATLSGWERAPWRPAARCPLCNALATLRVKFAGDTATATCVACREAWTQANIGILAAHIAGQGSEPVEGRTLAGVGE